MTIDNSARQTKKNAKSRIACYHARSGLTDRYGHRVEVLAMTPRGKHPHHVLVRFEDGQRAVTYYGCLRWKCKHANK